MEELKDIPKKCFACNICQKFTPTPSQEKRCIICGHLDEVHEQVSYYLHVFLIISTIYLLIIKMY